MNTNIPNETAVAQATAELTLEPIETSDVAQTTETTSAIPMRPATTTESLKLIGEGWGSIFVVIGIMIVVVALLNKLFSSKKK